MMIIIYCVFGITPTHSEEIKSIPVELTLVGYEQIRDEGGNLEKKKICKRVFHSAPDLAWYGDLN